MLRAAEFIKKGTYPSDEKRPPFFSTLLAANPGVDQVLWGRIVVFGLSILSFLVFERVCSELLHENKQINVALMLFTLNPVIFYWSIRIMSDVLFMLLVLIVFWTYLIFKRTQKLSYLLISGFIGGLSILTRFEGYILVGSLGLGIFLNKPKDLWKPLAYGLAVIILVGPYLLIRNPLTSTYLEEPGGRKYDLEMVLIYVSSILFAFGAVIFPLFIFKSRKFILNLLKSNYPLALFLAIEMFLVLIWPAAVPRLLMPVLPFFIIFIAYSLSDYFNPNFAVKNFVPVYLVLALIFILMQYFLKLQFLVSTKMNFGIIVLFQFLILGVVLFVRKYTLYAFFISCALWTFFVVDLHRYIFVSVKHAGEYALQNLEGNVAYNDVSSVSDWYTNYKSTKTKGFYYNTEKKKNLEQKVLLDQNIDYLIITNEHNTTMTLDLEKRPYLELLKEFRYNVNGKEFFAKVIKLRKNT
jgi:hypothetical protein